MCALTYFPQKNYKQTWTRIINSVCVCVCVCAGVCVCVCVWVGVSQPAHDSSFTNYEMFTCCTTRWLPVAYCKLFFRVNELDQ
jgi:hypothetical protein